MGTPRRKVRTTAGNGTVGHPEHKPPGITSLAVEGFKSIFERQCIAIRPLTLLAGVNSSGKSSMMQPLLLLKQTLEAAHDPGPIYLAGPNVRFTSVQQVLARLGKDRMAHAFRIRVGTPRGEMELAFAPSHVAKGFDVVETRFRVGDREVHLQTSSSARGGSIVLRKGQKEKQLKAGDPLTEEFAEFVGRDHPLGASLGVFLRPGMHLRIVRDRCFLALAASGRGAAAVPYPMYALHWEWGLRARELIHVPALRGNPERTYAVTAVGREFPGTFDRYVASVIARWKNAGEYGRLRALGLSLQGLGLTWKVDPVPVDDASVELRVGRLLRATRGGARDVVSIADVGFGVSQVLPVVVALLTAERGQLVYIEQPEIHLHPRGQAALAGVLAEAARRGVRVVVETHSGLLLRAVQTEVATGRLPPESVALHWFERTPDGATCVRSADVDATGGFGAWPVDFDEVALRTDKAYLDAVEAAQGDGPAEAEVGEH